MKTRYFALAALALAAACTTPALADKVTTDPNAIRTAAQTKQPEAAKPDSRLDQKINYTSTDKRLHTVLDDIAKQTGVTIYCGKTKDDWEVRDLPLVVCSNNLPLGTLLRSIADTTHLALTPFTVKDEKCYRIWRDSSREKQLADYYASKAVARRARANWEWDALVKMASLPEADISKAKTEESGSSGYSQDPEAVANFARILAALPPGSKEKVFAGEKLNLKVKDLPSPLSECVEAMYRDKYRSYRENEAKFALQYPDSAMHQPENKDLTEDQVRNACLTIWVPNCENTSLCSDLKTTNGFSTSPACDPGLLLANLKDKLPEEPKNLDPPKTQYAPNLQQFDNVFHMDEETERFKVEKPTDKKILTIADYAAAFSKASGYSIICEDFSSHKRFQSDGLQWSSTASIYDALMSLRNAVGDDIHIDKDNKLLVASAYAWHEHHKSLAPESVINHLRDKLNTDGAELDDATMIRSLSSDAYYEWILDSRELEPVAWAASAKDDPFWKLYDALSPADKALAKSKDGFPLIKLNSDYVTAVFRKSAEGAVEEEDRDEFHSLGRALQADQELDNRVMRWLEKWVDERYPGLRTSQTADGSSIDMDAMMDALKKQFPELQTIGQVPTDPKVIGKLKLYITKRDLPPFIIIREESETRSSTRFEERADGFKTHTYSMSIKGEGVSLLTSIPNLRFPVYSLEREAEVWKEMQKKKAESKK